MNFVLVDSAPAKRIETLAQRRMAEVIKRPDARSGAEKPLGPRRRQASRKSVNLAGDIAVSSSEWQSCTILDMSATGALLEIRARGADSERMLPIRFYLVMDNAFERSMVECVVRWQRAGRAGVQFTGPMEVSKRPAPKASKSVPARGR